MGPEEAGDDEGDEHVESQRAQAQPDGAVGGTEGYDRRQPSNGGEWVQFSGHDVDSQDGQDQEGKVPVQALGDETRPPRRGPTADRQDPEEYGRRQQYQADQAGPPGQVPQRAGAGHRGTQEGPGRGGRGPGQAASSGQPLRASA